MSSPQPAGRFVRSDGCYKIVEDAAADFSPLFQVITSRFDLEASARWKGSVHHLESPPAAHALLVQAAGMSRTTAPRPTPQEEEPPARGEASSFPCNGRRGFVIAAGGWPVGPGTFLAPDSGLRWSMCG